MAITRIGLNIEENLLKEIDEYAEKHSINRTSAICVLCKSHLDQQLAITNLSEVFKFISNINYCNNEIKK